MTRGETDFVEVALAVPLRGGCVLVARREPEVHLGGAWEFPGGKVETGESPEAAARRELAEETGLEATALEPLTVFVHAYDDRTVRIHAFLVRDPAGAVRVDRERPWDWVDAAELSRLEMPEANRAVLRALHWRFGSAARPEPK